MCPYKQQGYEYTLVLNMPKFWIWQSFEYGRILNMLALHSVLDMSEYALAEFWIYLRF